MASRPRDRCNNAIRHAHATTVTVTLKADAKSIGIEIKDDGVGIPSPIRRSGGGIGNMRTRARLISARFEIVRNKEGSGTSINVTLPAGMNLQGAEK